MTDAVGREAIKTAPTLAGLRARRDEILALAARYGASNVRVFGSVARGEATADSDIDLMVDFGETASLYDLSRLRLDLIELLGGAVDVIEDHHGLKERFKKRIMADVVTL